VGRTIDCHGLTARDINMPIRSEPTGDWLLTNPGGKHNLLVGISGDATVRIDGHAGAYLAGMNNGLDVHVSGSVSWGLAENNECGRVIVDGTAAAGAGASMRGGDVVVRGDVDVRAGIQKKGGLLVIGGDAGGMCGFMAQIGHIVVCGDARRGVADSMYEGVVLVGGRIAEPGNDTRVDTTVNADDAAAIERASELLGRSLDLPWQRITAGRRLWHFTKENMAMWRQM
jgi:methylamine---glutamate N-methyltransferase subunit B